MSSGEKQAEEAIVVSSIGEVEDDVAGIKVENSTAEEDVDGGGDGFSVKSFLWHGGSAWDAWFSCASNQVSTITLYNYLVIFSKAPNKTKVVLL